MRIMTCVLAAVVGTSGCAPSQQPPVGSASVTQPLEQDGAGFYQEVSWAPDGSALTVSILEASDAPSGFEYRVHRLDLAPLKLTPLTQGPMDLWTSWAPDGGRIAYASRSGDTSDIFTVRPDGSDPIRLTSHPADDTQPDWSPDGKRIAFVSRREGKEQVYVINADGSEESLIGNAVKDAQNPVWSPDGRLIAYYETDADGNDEVFVMNADGGRRRRLVQGVWPSWSPDGRRLLFGTARGLSVINLDGSGETLVLAGAEFGAFSPDGAKIAYIATVDGQVSVGVINADGSGNTRLLTRQAPKW